MMRAVLGILALVLLLGPAVELHAQSGSRGSRQEGSTESRQDMIARIQRDHERRLVRELKLSRSEMEQLSTIVSEFRGARMDLMRERWMLRRDLERHLEAEGSEAEARRLIDRARELRARDVTLQRQEEEHLLAVLSPSQLLRLQQMRDELADAIRRIEAQRPSHPDRRHDESESDGEKENGGGKEKRSAWEAVEVLGQPQYFNSLLVRHFRLTSDPAKG